MFRIPERGRHVTDEPQMIAPGLLLGFAEAIWHPNRQAMHDKIAWTVVLKI